LRIAQLLAKSSRLRPASLSDRADVTRYVMSEWEEPEPRHRPFGSDAPLWLRSSSRAPLWPPRMRMLGRPRVVSAPLQPSAGRRHATRSRERAGRT
jgi:hypothetical protein